MSAKLVQKLDRVVIRFAGDSGDGMQLTGDRFTSQTALLGNDLSTLPNFPAEIRAPQGTLPGVSSFQLHFADHNVLTPGDAPDVLVAMNPAALKANLRDLPRGATIIVNTDEFTKRNLSKVGYVESPLDDGSLDELRRAPGRPDLDRRRGPRLVHRPDPQGEGAREEHVRARPALVALHPADGRAPRRSSRRSSPTSPRSSRPTSPPCAPASTTARPPRTSRSPTRSRRPRCRRAPTATSPATSRCRSASSPPRTARTCRSSSAATRSPRPPTSCTRSPASSATASRRCRPRTRSPASAPRSARASAARSASRRRPGPGLALKAETIGLAVSLELPLIVCDIQRGGPSTGPADEDRAGRPAPGPLRPQRRVAGGGRRPGDAGRLLRHRRRGGAHRDDLPHARHRPVRRLPRQRLRAVAPAAHGRAARHRRGVRDRAQRRGRQGPADLPPLPARPRDARAAVGGPGHARPRAPGRRHREGRRHRQHLLRPRQPRPHDAAAPGQDRRDRRHHRPARRRRPDRRRRRARARAGARPSARSPRASAWRGPPAPASPRRTCATSTRSPPTPARCSAPTSASSCPR